MIIRLESETLRTIRESVKSLNVRFETYASQYTVTPVINKTLNTIQEMPEDKGGDDDENVEAKLSLSKVEGKKEWYFFQKCSAYLLRKGLLVCVMSFVLKFRKLLIWLRVTNFFFKIILSYCCLN